MPIFDCCYIEGSLSGFLQIQFFAYVWVMLQVTFSNVIFSADSEYVLTFYIRQPRTKCRHISVGDFYKKKHFSPNLKHKYAGKSWKDKRLLRKRYRSIAETFVNLKNKKGRRKLHLPKLDRKKNADIRLLLHRGLNEWIFANTIFRFCLGYVASYILIIRASFYMFSKVLL